MSRRSLACLAVLALASVLAAAAPAARVHIRIEGKTTTIFGKAEPLVDASNALVALDLASLAAEFYYHVQPTSFGDYVDQIGRYAGSGSSGWVFKVNGVSPPVGADKVTLKDGDRVLWYYATFGAAGGPPTLLLERLPAGCYQVWSQDDNGAKTAASGAVLRVEGRSVETANGRACPGLHRGLVRATLDGAVRSGAVR